MGAAGIGRRRVLHVVQNLNYGGMERLIGELARRVDDERFEPHVMVLQYLGRFARGLERHARLHVVDDLPPWSMLWPGALARQIRRIAPHVVHTHSGVWYKAARAARMAGVPRVVHTEHGRAKPDPWSHRLVDHLASWRTDVVVAVSRALEEELADRVGVDEGRIEVVTNGVDVRRFRPRPPEHGDGVRASLGLAPAAPVVGSVGRLEEVKGYGVMVDAFHRLVAGWPEDELLPQLVLVGDGSERRELEEKASSGPAAGCIHFLGWRDDVEALHGAFDLYSLSSWSEGTSVSLLEAMSSGLCPVVTDVGGNGAVLGEALAHRLLPAGEPGALARAWRDALADPRGRREDGRRARSRVEERYSVDAMVEAYERLYAPRRREDLAGGASPRTSGRRSPGPPDAAARDAGTPDPHRRDVRFG